MPGRGATCPPQLQAGETVPEQVLRDATLETAATSMAGLGIRLSLRFASARKHYRFVQPTRNGGDQVALQVIFLHQENFAVRCRLRLEGSNKIATIADKGL